MTISKPTDYGMDGKPHQGLGRGRKHHRGMSGPQVVAALREADATKMAAIGFCFGELCVLDLARAGAPLKSIASFHNMPEMGNL